MSFCLPLNPCTFVKRKIFSRSTSPCALTCLATASTQCFQQGHLDCHCVKTHLCLPTGMLWRSSSCFLCLVKSGLWGSAVGMWSPSERWADLAFRSTGHMCQCGHCPDIIVDLFQESQPLSILALVHKVGYNVSGPPEGSNPWGKCLLLCPAFILYHFFHVSITLSPPNIKRYFIS